MKTAQHYITVSWGLKESGNEQSAMEYFLLAAENYFLADNYTKASYYYDIIAKQEKRIELKREYFVKAIECLLENKNNGNSETYMSIYAICQSIEETLETENQQTKVKWLHNAVNFLIAGEIYDKAADYYEKIAKISQENFTEKINDLREAKKNQLCEDAQNFITTHQYQKAANNFEKLGDLLTETDPEKAWEFFCKSAINHERCSPPIYATTSDEVYEQLRDILNHHSEMKRIWKKLLLLLKPKNRNTKQFRWQSKV